MLCCVAVVELYEEPDKPPNPLEFIRRLLQGGSPESPGVETLRQEATELRAKNAELVEENTDLKARIEQLQTQQSYEVLMGKDHWLIVERRGWCSRNRRTSLVRRRKMVLRQSSDR